MKNILKRIFTAFAVVALAPLAIAGDVADSVLKIYRGIWKIIMGKQIEDY